MSLSTSQTVRKTIRYSICVMVASMLVVFASAMVGHHDAYAASGTSPVLSITNATSGKVSIKNGSTYKLGAKSAKAKLTYKSSDPSVVSVKKGKVTGLNVGKAVITVKATKGKAKTSKKVKVTVLKASKYKKVKSIKATTSSKNLKVAQKTKIKTTFKPKKASNKNLRYTSSDAKVIQVNENGTVTAVGVGTAKVTVVSADNKKAKQSVSFKVSKRESGSDSSGANPAPVGQYDTPTPTPTSSKIAVASVSARADETTLLEGEGTWISVTVSPSNATNKKVEFKSSNPNVVSVGSGGYVAAKGHGSASVIVTCVDNPQVKTTIAFQVVDYEYDDAEPVNPDVISAIEIDPSYPNTIDYANAAHVVQNAPFTVNEDGSVAVESSALPSGLNQGDVVVFEPTIENPFGAAVKVDEGGAYDGVLSGGIPDLKEIYDKVDVEVYGGVAEGGFTPEPGIELESTETVEIEDADESETTVIYPQSGTFNATTQGGGAGGSLQAARVEGLNTQGGLQTQAVSNDGKSTSKFGFKYKGISFSVALTGKVKYNYDFWGINELYVGVEAKNEVGFKGSLSNLFGAKAVDEKLGRAVFGTPVPGLYLEASVWFHVSADGEINVTLESTSETGVRYTKADGVKVVTDHSSKPSLKTSAELNIGFDFVGTLKLCAIDVADPSFDVRFKLGVDSNDAMVRPNGMRCNDVKLKFAPAISIGKHQGLCKTLGITYSKNIAEVVLKKWHLENGNLVNSCTWRANRKSYEQAGDLLPREGGMGSWGTNDALRVTLTWGASPEDLDSHLLGPTKSGGRFHVYYRDDEYSEDGMTKAFLDVDDTEGYGYETSTVYNASSGIYHFFVYQYSSDGAIPTSEAQVNVYKGNRLLATYDAPADIDDDYWYVFAYDAASGKLYPYDYQATDFEYAY